MTASWERHLESGLARLGIAADDRTRQRLCALLALLHKWNRAYNLTAVRSLDEMVTKHLLDSAAVLPFVTGPRLLDVGSGPGLPGLVLAILKPEIDVTLLDSNGKKVRFQRQALLELELANVTPVQQRVEQLAAPGFDQVISRAFASLADFVALTDHLLAPGGEWLAMKGRISDDELAGLPPGVAVRERHVLNVPGDEASRHLLRLERTG
ncbi:16S rRNA m(7)G-527 methyltransferase [Modicisalibacter ilicicola DSM 19980]|uniref:Ribosomal RNA small subunit methyltransferase G n=1 Tax=Modicisalibacter ilicicola DSM 19980 TaxID=1121942 RepID=A0A1M4VVY7_9GAMM|nr:16S rRNA (guanine(527)-N(7))-methyltransferase RsmG [Halomonas ilicicola]SHE73129.1 16S rRNA m(7)G-527 methyltransferase [Halomonas ilicicola DSM 19980]